MSNLKCPKCKNECLSLGAIEYKETDSSKSLGNMTGIGIGTNGIMVGSGGYSGNVTTKSKRAKHFAKPEDVILHGSMKFEKVIMIMISLISFIFISSLLNIFPNNEIPTLINDGIIGLGFILIFVILITPEHDNSEKESINKMKNKLTRERYSQLRYCEKCHLIYDENGENEFADDIGFKKMMEIKLPT